jgi:hypothetical protein
VLAITSGLNDMQAVLNVVWDCLLPAMGSAALPADEVTQAALAIKLANLALPLPEGGQFIVVGRQTERPALPTGREQSRSHYGDLRLR